MKQSDIFLASEGTAWIARNRDKPRDDDPVLKAMELLAIKPKSVLEIGCGDGWRLRELRRKYGSCCDGIDPGGPLAVALHRGTANDLSQFRSNLFDCVIFGFCLYLVDREDLFAVAAEADRVLQDGGWLIIHDFLPPTRPFARPYKHKEGVMSYHMDYAKLWLAHPWYSQINRHMPPQGIPWWRGKDLTLHDADSSVTVLRKDIASAFEI